MSGMSMPRPSSIALGSRDTRVDAAPAAGSCGRRDRTCRVGELMTTSDTRARVREDDRTFSHPALLYQGPWEYLSGTIPFILEGLAVDQPVVAAVPGPRLELLREHLGEAAERVGLLDMGVAGRNPGRIIAEVLRAAADAHPGRRVRIIGEPIWPGRSDVEYPACVQHEALINTAFRGRDVTILCPYDVVGLSPAVLADAVATHPTLIQGGVTWPSPGYAPERIVAEHNVPLPEPVNPVVVAFGSTQLGCARRRAREFAEEAGLGVDQADDVVLIVGELSANSVEHGGGLGVLRLWTADGHLVCEVHDPGVIDDPLIGRHPATQHQLAGRGLLMVNHLADLVRLHTGPDGTTVRAYLRLPTRD
jgi:anti-sigma regulatory factor (Ser/Thr protein kinase)